MEHAFELSTCPHRIALRDFGEAQLLQVLSILDEFGKQEWNNPSVRVRLSILKLANGDLDKLMDNTKIAIEDFRDVLSAAAYPRYSREIGFDKVTTHRWWWKGILALHGKPHRNDLTHWSFL